MLRRAAPILALGLAAYALLSASSAGAASCVPAYPGDTAPKGALALWMAGRAGDSGLPGPLPVMGALVESELQNLPPGDTDSAGFFQMRTSIWNSGDYAGFPTNPELQIKWFVDQALAVNQRRIQAGLPPYGADSSQWGEWNADVLRPPEQYRGRYQLRLAEALALTAGCPPAPSPPAGADFSAPPLKLLAKRVQDPLRRGAIVVEAACPAEACIATARASLSLPGAAKLYRLRSPSRSIAAGSKAKLRIPVGRRVRRALRRALGKRRRVKAKVSVTASDAAGNSSSARRTVSLRHGR